MKVLLVDDSAFLRERLIRLMSGNHLFNIAEAENSAEAIGLFHDFKPDVIILDISLPDESGIEVLRRMKTEQPVIPVIMLSNYATTSFRTICRELGADCFLDKSKDFRKILPILKKYAKN